MFVASLLSPSTGATYNSIFAFGISRSWQFDDEISEYSPEILIPIPLYREIVNESYVFSEILTIKPNDKRVDR